MRELLSTDMSLSRCMNIPNLGGLRCISDTLWRRTCQGLGPTSLGCKASRCGMYASELMRQGFVQRFRAMGWTGSKAEDRQAVPPSAARRPATAG